MTDILSGFKRVPLCHQPTALEEMPRLTAALGGPRLWIKRDDCTGLATGGNKTRKLEFLMADALDKGAEIVVTQGAVQSNHVRQTAAAACKLGLECYALLERRVPDKGRAYEQTGNVLFDHMFNTKIEFRPPGLDMNGEAMAVTERLRAEGKKAYFIPGGGSNEIGALGYVSTAQELLQQCADIGLSPKMVVLSTGSAGTHAGMVAGFHALGCDIPILGISVRQPEAVQIENVYKLAVKTATRLTDKSLSRDKVMVDDGYVGQGYGIPTSTMVEATHLLARNEGILLDPVYSGKGMAGLIGQIRSGQITRDGDVVFLHTGGAVSLFAYEDQFTSLDAAE
ncbi:MAG: D-cysteine desulfhydrase [Candidatus Puniceispirillaceae bacterium]